MKTQMHLSTCKIYERSVHAYAHSVSLSLPYHLRTCEVADQRGTAAIGHENTPERPPSPLALPL